MGWLSDWAKRIEIIIDNTNIDSDLTHFPVPIVLGTSVGQADDDVSCVFDELGSDANKKKIAVTKADGITEIYAEIELWDHANEKALLWVSKSDFVLSSTNTTSLFLYYDSAQSDNTSYIGEAGDTAAQNVWDSDFIAVYHMAQDPSGGADCILDSTSNENHGTPNGSMVSGDSVDGLLGKAINFNGSDAYIELNEITGDISSSDNFTIQKVFRTTTKATTYDRNKIMFSLHDSGGSTNILRNGI
ncbi:MAG: hypothetical protein WC372_12470, partial [Candidatus Neomarinimicrobiota bacterium]